MSTALQHENTLAEGAWSALLSREILAAPDRYERSFAAAKPYPHLILDDVFDRAFLKRIASEFPAVVRADWNVFDNKLERKLGTRAGRVLPPCAQTYFDLVYSGAFVRWLSRVSSIPWLLGDPWLIGGGMHVLPNGGYFDVHVDFQRHPHSGLDSRLVLLTFLNEDWREDYGGSLELWEADGSACAVRILPQMGRTVLFLQGPHMPHGVPEAVCAPLDAGRLSLAAYYYTGAVRNQNLEAPSTRFLNAARTRVYDDAKWLVKRLTPPILLDAAREMLGRASPWRHIDARQQEVIAPDKTRQNS